MYKDRPRVNHRQTYEDPYSLSDEILRRTRGKTSPSGVKGTEDSVERLGCVSSVSVEVCRQEVYKLPSARRNELIEGKDGFVNVNKIGKE